MIRTLVSRLMLQQQNHFLCISENNWMGAFVGAIGTHSPIDLSTVSVYQWNMTAHSEDKTGCAGMHNEHISYIKAVFFSSFFLTFPKLLSEDKKYVLCWKTTGHIRTSASNPWKSKIYVCSLCIWIKKYLLCFLT